MGVKLVVAVTDGDWFGMLRQQSGVPEVNFWSPGPKNFKALERGELFLFKLHSPGNFIVGGGIFAYANKLPSSLAWDAFGEADGVRSLREMRERIVKYRRDEADPRRDFTIGFRILTEPFFFPESDDYAFMGKNPESADNRWLREAFENRIPVIYFLGIAPGRYQAMFPVFISGCDA
jgi:putative restriction endonuclease